MLLISSVFLLQFVNVIRVLVFLYSSLTIVEDDYCIIRIWSLFSCATTSADLSAILDNDKVPSNLKAASSRKSVTSEIPFNAREINYNRQFLN